MALEVLTNAFQRMTLWYFEANVYSFPMVCSKISKKDPFYNVELMKEILKIIEKVERPSLPSNCNKLSEFIKEFWNLNTLKQSNLSKIYKRLDILKCKLLGGTSMANLLNFEAPKYYNY